MDELELSYSSGDALESHLGTEYENGRLFRLSTKLNQVIEKPEARATIGAELLGILCYSGFLSSIDEADS
jgi:hypothetical protein